MTAIQNMWKDDKGFVWMFAISIITLITIQLTGGFTWEGKFIHRTGFFLFTLIAVRSSLLSSVGKLVGYGIASAILLLAIVMIWIETQELNLLYTLLVTSYVVYIIALVVSQIFASQVVTTYKIAGGVAVYVLLGHIWATLYLSVYIIQPDSFQYAGGLVADDEAVKQLSYFSFVTLTTIGYGDITATNSIARIFVMLEGLLGQLFPAIFIAKLVSQQLEDSRKK